MRTGVDLWRSRHRRLPARHRAQPPTSTPTCSSSRFSGLVVVAALAHAHGLPDLHPRRRDDHDLPTPDRRGQDHRDADDRPAAHHRLQASTIVKILIAGTFVGFLTGLFGVGGGFVIVPALALVLKLPMPEAIGTSLLVVAVNSAVALTSRLASTSIDWATTVPFTVAAIAGVLTGGNVSPIASTPSAASDGSPPCSPPSPSTPPSTRAPPFSDPNTPARSPCDRSSPSRRHPWVTAATSSTTATSPSVIDPQRDIDRILDAADAAGVTITHVAETHLHNDYVRGGLALAQGHRRPLPARCCRAACPSTTSPSVRRATFVTVGACEVEVLHTPGHTQHHLSYVVHAPTTSRRRSSPAGRCSTARSAAPIWSPQRRPTS